MMNACDVPYVIGEETKYKDDGTSVLAQFSMGPLDATVQKNMREVWGKFSKDGNPGWTSEQIGKFADGKLTKDDSGAPISTGISNFLHDLMCKPAEFIAT